MPTYEYACKECEERLEVVQKFTDDALTTCPSCSGPLRKVFGSVGIAFKGSGFYKTDSRGKAPSSSSSEGGGAKAEGSDSAKTSEKSSETKSSDKPAATEKKSEAAKPAASTTGSAAAS